MAASERLFRRQISGLLIIAAIVLLVALLRADWHALFPLSWWRF